MAVSTDAAVCRHLALYWGIVPMAAAAEDFTDYASLCATIAQRCKLTRTGHSVLLVSRFNDDAALNAPMLKIQRV